MSVVWLAYVDESGNTGRRLDDPDQPVHWVVAVLVPEENVIPLTHAAQELVSQRRTDDLVPELHGAALFGGGGAWSGVPPAERVAIYEEALTLLTPHECVVAHASINKTKLTPGSTQKTTPHLLALQFLASGTGVVPGRVVNRVIDTVHFVRSEDNRGVQLADLVAYALNRVNRVGWKPTKAGDQALMSMLNRHVVPRVRTYRESWPS